MEREEFLEGITNFDIEENRRQMNAMGQDARDITIRKAIAEQLDSMVRQIQEKETPEEGDEQLMAQIIDRKNRILNFLERYKQIEGEFQREWQYFSGLDKDKEKDRPEFKNDEKILLEITEKLDEMYNDSENKDEKEQIAEREGILGMAFTNFERYMRLAEKHLDRKQNDDFER